MTKASRPDEFPTTRLEDFPSDVRAALMRQGRAARVVRLYRRRGWNGSAAVHEHRRASLAVTGALDALERSEMNPRLF